MTADGLICLSKRLSPLDNPQHCLRSSRRRKSRLLLSHTVGLSCQPRDATNYALHGGCPSNKNKIDSISINKTAVSSPLFAYWVVAPCRTHFLASWLWAMGSRRVCGCIVDGTFFPGGILEREVLQYNYRETESV